MVFWAWVTRYCCATTPPIPSSNVPTTTTLRIIIGGSPWFFPFARSTRNKQAAAIIICNPTRDGSFPALGDKISNTNPARMPADRDPDPLRGRRHIDVVDFVFTPQPVDDGVHDRRTGAD